MPSPRQTVSYLKRRFEEVGIEPVTRHGQNFLIDLNLLAILADSAELRPNDVVLEVGTGTGSLTALMAPRVGAVVTVEIDERLQQLAAEQLIDFTNVTMLRQDALKNKNRLAPAVLDTVQDRLASVPGARFKLVANLPFNVATPIISNLLASDRPPELMVVTIQKEVAERLIAEPATRDYGALSVWVQSQCDAEILRIMPPHAFWPRPKVDSAIVRVRLNWEKRRAIPDLAYYHAFVRSMFFHRRKLLRSELLSAFKKQFDKPTVDAILEELGLVGDARAEQLTPAGFLALCEAARRRADAPPSEETDDSEES